jgi:hypothetical protein
VPASTTAIGSVAFCTAVYARLPTGSRPPCGRASGIRWFCDGLRRMVEAHAPVLEMLWETQDPHHVLCRRCGFGDGKSAEGWVAGMLDEH